MKKVVEVNGVPHVMVIDPEGIMRWDGYPLLAGHELKESTIEEIIKKHAK